MPGPGTTVPYWAREADSLVAALGSGPRGLSETGAAERLAVVGRNRVEDTRQKGPFRLLLRQFESPLVLILVFAAAVSIGLSGGWTRDHPRDRAGAALLGFTQEYRASTAVGAPAPPSPCRVVATGRADVEARRSCPRTSSSRRQPDPRRRPRAQAHDFLVSGRA
jgi:Mg2+-importing ATPase